MAGSVETASGDVPLTMHLVATRHGRHTVTTLVTVGGPLTSTDRRMLKQNTAHLARLATAKVEVRLGR